MLLREFLTETNKIERIIFKTENFFEELSKDMILTLLEEIKIKTYQKTLPSEYSKIFNPNDLVKAFTLM